MPIPPSPALRESLSPGDTGHIADHEAIAEALNNDTVSLTGPSFISNKTTTSNVALRFAAASKKIFWDFTGGDDANDGLSAGSAMKTLQACIDELDSGSAIVGTVEAVGVFTETKSGTIATIGDGTKYLALRVVGASGNFGPNGPVAMTSLVQSGAGQTTILVTPKASASQSVLLEGLQITPGAGTGIKYQTNQVVSPEMRNVTFLGGLVGIDYAADSLSAIHDNVNFVASATGIKVSGGTSHNLHQHRNCYFQACGTYSMDIGGRCDAWTFDDCVTEGGGPFRLNGTAAGWKFDNLWVEGPTGPVFQIEANQTVSNFTFDKPNIIGTGSTQDFFLLNGAAARLFQVTINDAKLNTFGTGKWVDSVSTDPANINESGCSGLMFINSDAANIKGGYTQQALATILAVTVIGDAGAGWTSANIETNSVYSVKPWFNLILGNTTLSGKLSTAASIAANAGLRIPHGTAPSAPADGDMWSTTAGLFIRINGVTKTVTLT